MYGHEVLMSLQTRAMLFGTHFLHRQHVSGVRLRRLTVYSMEQRWQHFQHCLMWTILLASNRSKLYFSLWVSPEQYRGDLTATL
jgi:hypothetical protein